MSSQQGDTPLIMATKKEMVEIVRLLLDRRADISSRNQVYYLTISNFYFQIKSYSYNFITDLYNNTV